MPDFMRQLRGRAAIAARALELTVLCATRTNETLKMKWSEVNLQTEVWTVPKERMKMNVEHRIPLPPRAVEIIKEMVRGAKCDPDSYVFPGQSRGSSLSQMSMTMLQIGRASCRERVSVRVDLGGRRIIKKKNKTNIQNNKIKR